MTLIEFVSVAAIPISILATFAMVFVAVALTNKKNRTETVNAILSIDFGIRRFTTIASLWALYFHKLFGGRIFAKRQLLTIPIYTLVVSGVFFLIWFAYLYIFRNPEYSFTVKLPLHVKQSISDFYREGIFAALLLDFFIIQLTKIAIRVGTKSSFYSMRFFFIFLATLVIAYFLFSLAVYFFRVEDMVRLYVERAPNDPIPLMQYAPITNFHSSLNLFYPQTLIHVTSQGWLSTYFMPEPLIFYCAVASHMSLLFVTLGYQIAAGLYSLKNFCVRFVKNVGTPMVNAYSVISLVIIVLISIPIVLLSILSMINGVIR